MPFEYKPAIYKNAQLYELPKPILSLKLQDSWNQEQFRVPLATGDVLVGHAQNGLTISVKGELHHTTGTPKAAELALFDDLETLRAALSTSSPDERYELLLYHDDNAELYRRLVSCATLHFQFDFADQHRMVYGIEIHAEDPIIYTTAPGT